MKYNDDKAYRLTKLDYKRREELMNNPELKLPNIDNARIDKRKFTHYLFDGSTEKGLVKGNLITRKLGYSINNYKEFEKEILNRARDYPVISKGDNTFGTKYEQKMIMYSPNGKPVNIVAGWMVKNNETHMTTIMIKEAKE